MPTKDFAGQLILLSEQDNVLVAARDFEAGEWLSMDGELRLAARLPIGHKVARQAIAEGDTVFKYGAPIGRAVRPIALGEHVHIHNIVSNYTRTHVIE
ncbi:MAG: UxaA family hydrolase [Polaromonas sp.]